MLSFGREKKEGTYRRIDESRPTLLYYVYPNIRSLNCSLPRLGKRKRKKRRKCAAQLDHGCVGGGDMRMTLKRDSTQAITFLTGENLTTTTRTYRAGGQWRQASK